MIFLFTAISESSPQNDQVIVTGLAPPVAAAVVAVLVVAGAVVLEVIVGVGSPQAASKIVNIMVKITGSEIFLNNFELSKLDSPYVSTPAWFFEGTK
jgi:hypothetical protein